MKKITNLMIMLCLAIIAVFSVTACEEAEEPHTTHTAVKKEAVAATCKNEGTREYWTCSGCDEIFLNEECTVKATLDTLKLPTIEHTPAKDDGDCTTAIKCIICGDVVTEARGAHTPVNDDGDCTTAVGCAVCDKIVIAAKPKHTPGADDGDCTTAISCAQCGSVFGETKEHNDANYDGKCDNNCDYRFDYVYDEENETYIVFTAEGLYAWAEDSWKGINLLLGNDIVLPSELRFDIDGDGTNDSNWEPQQISKTIDGNGYSIRGLVIKLSKEDDFQGFISNLYSGGVIKNLRILDADMSLVGINHAILVGYNDGLIENCGVSGKLYTVGNNVGGIVGTNSGKIVACYNDAQITATRGGVGGIVGQNVNGNDVIGCYNTGEISSLEGDAVSGIAGDFYGGSIIASYSTSALSANGQCGGIAGYGDSDGTLVSNYWSAPGDLPQYGIGNREINENAEKVDGETITWSSAMTAMNAALEDGEYEWRYALNTGDDAATRPLIIVSAK